MTRDTATLRTWHGSGDSWFWHLYRRHQMRFIWGHGTSHGSGKRCWTWSTGNVVGHGWRGLVGGRRLAVCHGWHGASRRLGRIRRLTLTWMNRPLTVLIGPALRVICTAHGRVRRPVALPARVRVVHISPGVPHVTLRSAAGSGGRSPTHHAMLRRSLSPMWHAFTVIWVWELPLHRSALRVSPELAIHIWLLATELHAIGITFMSLCRGAIHPLPRSFITLKSHRIILEGMFPKTE